VVAAPEVPAEEEPLDYLKALKVVLKKSLQHDGLARGIRESVKALDRKEAHLAVLAESCNEPSYVRLIEALTNEHKVHLLKVPSGTDLGEWAGLAKYDKEGAVKKCKGTSCVVVRDYGETSRELDFLFDYFKTQGKN
jgi:small subunit ribosomal protein S12e